MAVTLRSRREIELLRRAGAVVARVLSQLERVIEPGITTEELDKVARQITADEGAEALFQGVRNPSAGFPFPGAICTSINEQVVHGIPSKDIRVEEGDILSIDYGARLAGYCSDAAVTVAVGTISDDKRRLIDVTRQLLDIAIEKSTPGVKWSAITAEMQNCAESAGFSVVREFVGHGIGTEMWEEPKVPNFVSDELLADDIILQEGMILAVEPMVNMGTYAVRTLKDGWTVVTKDRKCSAHFEHTLTIVKNGCEVLTA